MIPKIIHTLTWAAPHHSDLIQQWRLQRTVGFLKEYDARSQLEEEQISKLLDRIGDLPAQSFLRVFKAPETFWRTLRCAKNGGGSYLKFLETAIEVERCIAGQQYKISGSAWSALGDAKVSGSNVWRGASHNQAKSGGLSIILDGSSPYARRPFINRRLSEINIGKASRFSTCQQLLNHKKVSEALDAINTICDRVSDFVYQNINTIVSYHDVSNSRHFSSASTNRFIGQMLLVNPSLEGASISYLANAIVHESVHSYLYAIELQQPLIRKQKPPSRLIVSPWTGSPLSLHSYVHACFVWQALRNFWELDGARAFFGHNCEAYAAAARVGFMNNEFNRRLIPYVDILEESALKEITDLCS